MSLVKPVRGRLGLEAAQEQALDIQILEQIAEIRDGQEYLSVVLLGGKYKEIAHPGQLPSMMKEIELLRREGELRDARIEALEAKEIERKAVVRTASRIAAFEGSVIGAAITLAVEFFRRK